MLNKRPVGSDELAVVVGGQYGSEGKGAVTARLVRRAFAGGKHVLNVRVGGPNAGHTVIDHSGVAWPLRQIPVGAVEHNALLYIAPGSEIDPEVLLSEIRELNAAGFQLNGRLYISDEATVLEAKHKEAEQSLLMPESLGSTGKGIGAARASRLMRDAARVCDDRELRKELANHGVFLWHGPSLPAGGEVGPRAVIVEGTQGYGLGLHAGFYPKCTSGDARAIDFLAQAGISPWQASFDQGAFTVWVVVRPNPIRVAGNSGPLLGETTWEELGLPVEHTTVTKKVRRVGAWDADLVREAVEANGGPAAVKLAHTMMDHVFPELYGAERTIRDQHLYQRVWDYLSTLHDQIGAPVRMITTGPNSGMFW